MSVLSEFAGGFPKCWLCGCPDAGGATTMEIHHIARGVHRAAGKNVRANLIRTCHYCHETRLASMPIAMQLALKFAHDPDHYDRVSVNRLRHRADNAVSEVDVASELLSLAHKTLRRLNATTPRKEIV
jgi:hypothetical protein